MEESQHNHTKIFTRFFLILLVTQVIFSLLFYFFLPNELLINLSGNDIYLNKLIVLFLFLVIHISLYFYQNNPFKDKIMGEAVFLSISTFMAFSPIWIYIITILNLKNISLIKGLIVFSLFIPIFFFIVIALYTFYYKQISKNKN